MSWRIFVNLCVVFLWIQGEVKCEKDRNNCIFHYWQVDWKTAMKTCEEDNMELLCYTSEKEIDDITEAFRLAAITSAKLAFWLSSSNCSSDTGLEECLSLHIKKTNGEVWHYIQNDCDDVYPFVCCVNGSAEFTTPIEYITSSPSNQTSDVFDITSSSLLTTTHKASSIKSDFCKSTSKRGMVWPDTEVGEIAILPCPGDSTGKARWVCEYGTKGKWRKDGPNMTQCRSRKIQNLKDRFNSTSASNVISELEDIFNDRQKHIFAEDLADLFSLMIELPDRLYLEMDAFTIFEKWKSTSKNMNKVKNVVDQIVELKDIWKDIKEKERATVGTHLLTTMDGMGSLLAYSMPENVNEHSMQGKNMALQVLRPQLGESISLPQWIVTNNYSHRGSVMLLKGYDNQLVKDKENISLVFAVHTNMSTILSPTQEEERDYTSSLNSAVLSVTVYQGRKSVRINNEVQILVEHLASNPNNSACVFWNMDLDQWNTAGCHLESSNATHSTCVCNHLTNFALLMDYGEVLRDVDQDPFNYITLIGCSLSILCLAVCVIIFSCYSYHSRHSWGLRYVIHRNLCLTLLIANLVLVVGLDKTENQRMCAIIAGLLHYFFLSAFSWMFLEAVHIYLLLVVVFASRKSHSEKYYAFGYGFPFIIVAITALSRPTYYGTDDVCWLSVKKGTIWGFMGPVATILILNMAALILAQYKASRISVKDDKVALFARWLRVTFILFPVLGVTWLFGFLYLGKHFEIAGYLFAIFNSFQGVCIFICHCLLDKKARNMVMDSFKKKSSSIHTGTSSTLKKMKEQPKNGVKSNSITPIESDESNTRKQPFQLPKMRIKRDWTKWRKPWSFCFELPVSDANLHKEKGNIPHAVIVNLNSLPDKNCV